MRIPHKYLFVFPLLFTLSWSCDNISSPGNNPNNEYPTTLYVLSQAERDSLQIILNQQLGTEYHAKIDSFGLLQWNGILMRGTSTISDPVHAISLAKKALVRLNDFSNVMDTSTLHVRDASHTSAPGISDWYISFQAQHFKNMEVFGTDIYAIVADNFILLDGHYYKNIFIPTQNLLSKEQAKNKLVGTTIYFDCWTPSTFKITDSTINIDSMKLCVYPLQTPGKIELRVAWQIPVSHSVYWSPQWFYFIDVLTGEIIGSRQLFIC
jgi:hypothetical protein